MIIDSHFRRDVGVKPAGGLARRYFPTLHKPYAPQRPKLLLVACWLLCKGRGFVRPILFVQVNRRLTWKRKENQDLLAGQVTATIEAT